MKLHPLIAATVMAAAVVAEAADVLPKVCRLCGRQFKTGDALNNHLWAKHTEVKKPRGKLSR